MSAQVGILAVAVALLLIVGEFDLSVGYHGGLRCLNRAVVTTEIAFFWTPVLYRIAGNVISIEEINWTGRPAAEVLEKAIRKSNGSIKDR